jgi:hypothetical protein
MYAYVIHLKRRTDRYEQFRAAWEAAGLTSDNIHWFNAVEGVKLPPRAFKKFHTVARTHRARAGRLGAYLSHTGAIAAAIKANHFPLLILEDDAIPTAPLTSADLRSMFDTAPSTANLLYFGALPVKDRKRDRTYCTRRRSRWSHAADSSTRLFGGHAYGFRTADAAQQVLAELLQSRITFDSALVRYQKNHPEKVAVFCPFVFKQASGYSDIEGVERTW